MRIGEIVRQTGISPGAGAYRCYLYAPVPKEPALSAALVLVLHGSNLDGAKMRQWMGYEFDELTDRLGLIILYPDGYKGNWNDCRRDATFPAKTENIDDVGFMGALVAHYQAAYPPTRAGYSPLGIPTADNWRSGSLSKSPGSCVPWPPRAPTCLPPAPAPARSKARLPASCW